MMRTKYPVQAHTSSKMQPSNMAPNNSLVMHLAPGYPTTTMSKNASNLGKSQAQEPTSPKSKSILTLEE